MRRDRPLPLPGRGAGGGTRESSAGAVSARPGLGLTQPMGATVPTCDRIEAGGSVGAAARGSGAGAREAAAGGETEAVAAKERAPATAEAATGGGCG